MGSLAHLLKNRFYIGEIIYRGEMHHGEHEPILTRDLFEAVQAKRVSNGTVTLPNRARNKSAGMLGSRRSDDVAPRLHRRGPEGSVRFCGGEMALDVESVVSGCVG